MLESNAFQKFAENERPPSAALRPHKGGPFLSERYDLTKHPNYHLTDDADKRNIFDIEKFLSHRLKLKTDDEYTVIDADYKPDR